MTNADRPAVTDCFRHIERFVKLDELQKQSTERAQDRQIMMKLYSADLSPYSARVRMQIYSKGITDIVFELPEHWGMPKFRERFPIGRLPVLDIDGDMIPESEVIAEYLEAIHPEPSLLGITPRETAHIRMLARLGDIYIINNMFMLARQTGALSRRTPTAARDDGVSGQLAIEVVRNLKALDTFIGKDGFACGGRITLADCALVPGLFFVDTVMPAAGVDTPIPAMKNVAAYWAAIRENEHGARVLIELDRGLEERREMIRSGALDRFRAARDAAQKEADAHNGWNAN
jgi:glutathione S-transferase